jgi:5-methyltetrahydrofolate--homocysteine methyltransferase
VIDMVSVLDFSKNDWDNHANNWNAWWAGDLERPLVMIESPPRIRTSEELTIDFLLKKPVDQVLAFYQSRFAYTSLYGDAWPRWFPFFGAGVAAAFLGAELLCASEERTIWFEPSQPLEGYEISVLFDPQNIWWQRIQQLTKAAVDHWGSQICVGFTDLGGNLDILASLRNSQPLLMDLMDCPEEIETATQQITHLWGRYYHELQTITQKTGRGSTPWAPIWAPGNCYMLQSDFSAMISPKMFERFVLPDLVSCCQELDYAFYHMDGKGQIPHLDMLLSIEKLRGIQWIPGDGQPPPEGWLPLLKRIRDGGKLCQLFVSAKGALEISRQLNGKGFAFYITEYLDDDEAKDFLNEMNFVP